MKNEFTLAFNEVLEEKQLPKTVILEALEAAMVSAYRRAVNASSAQHVEAKVDPETGKVVIFAEKEIVETVQDERTEVSLSDARRLDPAAELGGMIVVESTPRDFGRVAAQTARQVIQQRIREAERDSQMAYYNKQVGEIVSGVVQAVGPQGLTLGLEMKAEGLLPRNHQIPGERFRVHDRVRAILLEVKPTPRGPQIILSRAHRNFLRRLLENEVPEIYHGMVEIRSISREPGQRSKVAVAALQPAVDPVGACVGIRGVRIQAIVRELNDEKIDVIEWSQDPAVYIAKSLSPARVSGVYLNDQAKGAKTATVVVPEDQLSLAIGRDGQNARLAAKLTGWRIDIKSLPEAAADALNRLQTDADYAALAEAEAAVMPQVEAILAKKAEGRPVPPEEYTLLNQFVDRVERGILRQRQAEKRVEDEREAAARATLPEAAFLMPLEDLGLPPRVYDLLTQAGYNTIGELMLQLKLDADSILALDGVGSKVMRDIETALEAVTFPEPVKPPEPEAVTLPEAAAAPIEEAALPVQPVELAEVVQPVEPEQPVTEVAIPVETPLELAETEVQTLAQQTMAEIPDSAPEKPAISEDIFKIISLEEMTAERSLDEEDEDIKDRKGKKDKKKKKRYVEVEYDPDQDITIAKKKRKRGGEWEDGWEF